MFAQLGEDLNNLSSAWHDRVLLPGGTEASATMTLPAAHYAVLVTEMDTEAYLTGILGTALNVLASMTGKLAVSTAGVLGLLAKGTCLRDLVRTAQTASLAPQSAESLGAAGFECITAAADLGAAGIVASLASLISSLASELLSGIWGTVDSATGNGYHVLTVSRTAAAPACSAAALFAAAVAGQHFSPNPGFYPPYPGQGPGAYGPVCDGTWAIALVSHPRVGTTDGGVLFRAVGGEWVYKAGVGGVPADCILEQLGVPVSIAEVLWPPGKSAGASYCSQT